MSPRTSVFKGLALLTVAALGLAACEEENITVQPDALTVTFAQPALTLSVGQEVSLGVNVSGVPAGQPSGFTCSSGNPAVVTVTNAATCTIRAVSPGVASITATTAAVQNGAAKTSTSIITVTGSAITVNIVPEAATVNVGGNTQFAATVQGTANQTVTFRSLNTAVATVNPTTGVATGVAAGTAIIQALSAADTTARANAVLTVQVAPPSVVTVNPASATLTRRGEQIPITAQVSGTTNQAVRCVVGTQTANPAGGPLPVVTVDSLTCIVTAQNPGSATITVRSVATGATGTATVAVNIAPTSIVISNFTTGGAVINPNAVVGQIEINTFVTGAQGQNELIVTMSGARTNDPTPGLLRPLRGDTVCIVTFIGTQQGVPVQCIVNTAMFDLADPDVVRWLNGPHNIQAAVREVQSGSTAASTQQTIVLANPDAAAIQCTPTTAGQPILGAGGVAFVGANTSCIVTPLRYSGGAQFQTLNFTFGGANLTATFNGNVSDTVVFNATASGQSTATATTAVTATGSVVTVATGPTTTFVFDVQAPSPGVWIVPVQSADTACSANDWLSNAPNGEGAAGRIGCQFANFVSVAPTDVGFGGSGFGTAPAPFAEFFVQAAGASCSATGIANIPAETSVTAATLTRLGNPTTNTAVQICVRVRDVVGNTSFTLVQDADLAAPFDFGIDLTPPSSVSVVGAPADSAFFNCENTGGTPDCSTPGVFAGASFGISATEDLSGFGPQPVVAMITGQTVTGTACIFGDEVGGEPEFGGADSACELANAPLSGASIPAGSQGYLRFTGFVQNAAGLSTPLSTTLILVDLAAPIVTDIEFPPTLVGGTTLTWNMNADDNVDLAFGSIRQEFTVNAGVEDLPFAGETMFAGSDGFGGNLATRDSVIQSWPFVRALFSTKAGDVIATAAEIGASPATNITAYAYDVAGNFGLREEALPATFTTTNNIVGTINLSSGTVTNTWATTFAPVAGSTICRDPAGACVGSTTLTAAITGPAGTFANPFVNVYFFVREIATGEIWRVGVTTSATITESTATPGIRTISFTTNFNPNALLTPAGNPIDGPVVFFAVGVDAQGDAIATQYVSGITIAP